MSEQLNGSLVLCLGPIEALTGVDCVVNPTDPTMTHNESPLARRLAAAAGPGLADECRALGKLQLGHALLPAKPFA